MKWREEVWESRQSVQTSMGSADNDTRFLVKFQARVFIAMSSEFKFGGNSDEFSIFRFFHEFG